MLDFFFFGKKWGMNIEKRKSLPNGDPTITFLLNSHFIAFIKHLSSHDIVQRLINKNCHQRKSNCDIE